MPSVRVQGSASIRALISADGGFFRERSGGGEGASHWTVAVRMKLDSLEDCCSR